MSRVRAGESFLVVGAPSRRGSGLAAERGDAFVELVVVAPLLLLMLGVAVVMGQLLDAKASAADVAREAARIAVEQPGARAGGDAATRAARDRAAAL
ncbi:MAG TPA: TadE/TadG family type IV pilus assembly protein, partial [Acidimicrobiales bacterium]